MKLESLEKVRKNLPNWSIVELNNNLPCIHIPAPASNKFFIGFYVKAGSRLENKENSGVSHFLEHMMFRGSKNYPSSKSLSQAFESLGGEWNAATSYEHTEYTYSGLSIYQDKIISLFSEFLTKPLFLDFEKEKNIILREIEDDLNEFGFFTDLDHQSAKLFWPESSKSLPITGTKKSIEGISKKTLIDYYKMYYKPENCVLCIMGGDEGSINLESLNQYFSEFSSSANVLSPIVFSDKPRRTGPLCKLIPNSDNQYHVQINFTCDDNFSKNKVSFKLIAYILTGGFSSLLSYKVREELGLVYDISASLEKFSDEGVFSIYFSTTEKYLNKTVHEVFKILRELKYNRLSKDVFDRAKMQFNVETTLLYEDFEGLCYYLARRKLSGLNPEIYREQQDALQCTLSDLQEDFIKTFDLKNCGVVLLGDKDTNLESEILKIIKKYL